MDSLIGADGQDGVDGIDGRDGSDGECDTGDLEDVKLENPLEFTDGTSGENAVLAAMKIGIKLSEKEEDILMTTADEVEWNDVEDLKIEPWRNQETGGKAIKNTDDIYQKGNVAIGKIEEFIENATLDVAGSIVGGNPDQNGVLGENSIAVDDGVIASGKNSMAIGYGSEATEYGAFAGGGFQNTSSQTEQIGGQAKGKTSFAFGRETKAEGNYSVAIWL